MNPSSEGEEWHVLLSGKSLGVFFTKVGEVDRDPTWMAVHATALERENAALRDERDEARRGWAGTTEAYDAARRNNEAWEKEGMALADRAKAAEEERDRLRALVEEAKELALELRSQDYVFEEARQDAIAWLFLAEQEVKQ